MKNKVYDGRFHHKNCGGHINLSQNCNEITTRFRGGTVRDYAVTKFGK